ncbi:MAG TPA: hypothetical protein VMY42_24730 [Thermoguttaceae bacterium]|nr:hypothetical protein [Thermoguttaceae bacterium]
MGMEWNASGDFPKIARTAFIHETATLIGNVSIEGRVFVGPNAVIRADEPGPEGKVEPIVVCEEANIQDAVVIHALGGTGVKIGPRTSISHAAIVHGPCEIGADCFVGFGAVVFKATLGDGVVVLHRALVEGVTIPPGVHVPSMTAVCCEKHVGRLTPVPPELAAFAEKVCRTNLFLVEAGLKKG